jgi:hypothetical protein
MLTNVNFKSKNLILLFQLGMKQLKNLGEFFQQRYAGSFASMDFNSTQVFIRSSDSDRALVSAQSMLNGFFPPTDKIEKFEDDLDWQPIAVHAATPNEPDPVRIYRG